MQNKKQGQGTPFKLPEEAIVPGGNPQPQQQMNLQQLLMQAGQLQAQGRLQESETLLRQILQAQPDCAPALHLLGVIAHQCGQNDTAIGLIRKSIAVNGNVALFHANLGEMLRIKGDIDAAIEHGEKAVALEPGMCGALSNLGIAYYDKEDYEKAKQCHQKALALEANLPQSLNNMGSIMRAEDNLARAIEYYHKAIVANAHYLEPLNNLGLVLIEDDRHSEAIAPLTNAVTQNPNYADAWCNLGCAYTVLEQYDKGLAAYQKAAELKPDYVAAHLGIGRVHFDNGDFQAAQESINRALAIDPEHPESYSMLASVYNELAFLDKADAAFAKAIELDPELASAYLGRANMHMEGGDFDIAEDCLNKAIVLEPESLAIRFAFTQLKKVKPGNEHFKALLEDYNPDTLNKKEAIHYHYALGKCYDDTGDHERAFEHCIRAGTLKRETLGYDPKAHERLMNQLREIFSVEFISGLAGGGNDSSAPIFVLGMPRSGTTLTEQIIASHPEVYGAGELQDIHAIASRLISPAGRDYPRNLSGMDIPALKMMGDAYVEQLIERAPGNTHITDKMPGNFHLMGFIHLILPNARIIHVKRNPLDTCISAYMRLFRYGLEHSYDLYESGLYYRDYYRLMQHWREVLPAGSFYELQYEELIQDNENQARKLIDYCRLDWNDACLQSHKTKRTVKTASITQVRQPIYTSSLERWRRYDRFLGPLKEGLGDVPY